MRFEKGNIPWNKGKKQSPELRQRIAELRAIKKKKRLDWLFNLNQRKTNKRQYYKFKYNSNVVLDLKA